MRSMARGRTGKNGRRTELLASLGVTVRAQRTAAGMTLKALAQAANVSERFLVQLEGGEGNISVARLEDIAEALATTGARLLGAASGVENVETRVPVLALVGLRGAGKSSI